jgi:hypothetical protein
MADELMNMSLDEAIPLARALGHYLNLTSIAELHHRRGARVCVVAQRRVCQHTRSTHTLRLLVVAAGCTCRHDVGMRACAHPRCPPPSPPPPTHPRVRRARSEGKNPKSCEEVFERLITEGVEPDDLYHEVTHQVRSMRGGMQRSAAQRSAVHMCARSSCAAQGVQRRADPAPAPSGRVD